MKHTFSCVNGTVFNQMSFTCTRHQDSIPCDSSPNYFYLNKRNGDPKAFFLTEEDIVKPGASNNNGHSRSSSSNGDSSRSLQSLYSNSNHLPETVSHSISSSSSRAAISAPPTAISLRPTSSNAYTTATSSSSLSANHRPSISLISSKSLAEQEESYGLRPGRLMGGDYNENNDHSGGGNSLITITGGGGNSGSSSSSGYAKVDPYDISSKYSNIKPGVKYSMKAIKSKYEASSPSKKKSPTSFYDLPSPHLSSSSSSGYVEDLHRTGPSGNNNHYQSTTDSLINNYLARSTAVESLSPSSASASAGTQKYRHLTMGYQPAGISISNPNQNQGPSKIDQLLAKYGASNGEVSATAATTSKENYQGGGGAGYHRAAIESPPKSQLMYTAAAAASKPRSPTPTPSSHSSSAAFTPASFSKLYMENVQKASKSYQMASGNELVHKPYHQHSSQPQHHQHHNHYHQHLPKSATSNQLVDRQSKSYTAIPFPASAGRPAKSSKYVDASSSPSHYHQPQHQVINSNQYEVPSSIRIIEDGKGSSSLTPLSSIDAGSHSSSSSFGSSENPVKMSFVSKGSSAGSGDQGSSSSVADFGNLRVVKQVKGKNLLIDPSLENDPARDNIIAQVLEMLNKYN